jgi:hypothetical protein
MAFSRADRWLAVVLVLVGGAGLWWMSTMKPVSRSAPVADASAPKLGPVWVGTSANYEITSHATVEQTGIVGSTTEALLRSYLQFFALDDTAIPKGGLKLRLFKDRAQFKERVANAPAWAEAIYRNGVCYAYFDASSANGYHWMLHEATHQLNELVGHTPKAKWVNEGLASYFGASKLEDNALLPGRIEPKAYPVWWLGELAPTGSLQRDIASGRVVPLRALLSGEGGPDIDSHVNQWYLGYWSLTHFLLHGADGKYAAGYRELLKGNSATPADFERLIGPVDAVQAEWYGYLQGLAGGKTDQQVIVVD